MGSSTVRDASAPDPALCIELADEADTQGWAARLARVLEPGLVVHLSGDLGSGKTTFCRALLRALGYKGRVKSPTFTLVEAYEVSELMVYHFDLYRLNAGSELREAGFEEQLDGRSVALVEWPERAGDALPEPDLRLRLEWLDDQRRRATWHAFSERGRRCLMRLASPEAAAGDSCAPA